MDYSLILFILSYTSAFVFSLLFRIFSVCDSARLSVSSLAHCKCLVLYSNPVGENTLDLISIRQS